MTTSLELGCDCLGEIRYVDAVLHDSLGEPYDDQERDLPARGGQRGAVEARRPRRPAPRCAGSAGWWCPCHATVANYEYLVYWRFYQDGNIECEVRATGIMVTTPYAEGAAARRTGTVVDERTYAPFHQHFLVARLDLDVDGADNTVMEVDSQAAADRRRTTRTGSRVVTEATPIALGGRVGPRLQLGDPARLEGGQPETAQRARHARSPTSWCPARRSRSMMDPSTPQYLRAPVIGHTLWVTRQHDDERWPCGDLSRRSREPTTG